ncbi:MAG: type II toxin-antitoxin system VapC family toxin [Actinomycetota bacterium]|nr:type II toxin-antitoxin system VapC family toxin [Actinomycetota bacterium]
MPTSGAEIRQSRVVLDTSAYSHLRRGEEQVLEAVAHAETVLVPVTVLGELEAGFRIGSRYLDNRRALEDFLEEPYVHVVDVTADIAVRYGEVFADLRSAGTPVPINDVWIAAATSAREAHLITFDEDFSRIEGLSHTLLGPA